ncbi:membrane protein [Dyella thiooxydans]|uniref:Membrane protein n=1 Tax=Dyella thiooxydans TaxID=445710 RepID=A0A160N0B0_9GAMM|nr:EamA family transporter [Dyella thiooxydans]AND69203.1 membrane protein [Dyella thiooxydans]
MKRFYLVGFALLMTFDTFNFICFKMAGNHALPVEASVAWLLRLSSEPWVYGAVVGYLGAFFTWMTLLKHAPIGPAFAASHLEVVSVMLLSVWLFHEPLTATKLIGATAIIAGIVCLGLAEREEAPPDAA